MLYRILIFKIVRISEIHNMRQYSKHHCQVIRSQATVKSYEAVIGSHGAMIGLMGSLSNIGLDGTVIASNLAIQKNC